MQISDEGLRLICSFEGYHTKQADGSCKAYRCPAGVWTNGYGCTVGVGPNTHWTRAEAEQKFRQELDKFEAAVLHLVKVPLNQNEFDSLVSFSYNLGEGTLARSKLLKLLNSEKRVEAAGEFRLYVKARDPDNGNKLRVLKGLVSRRSREAALFLKPTEEPQTPIMAQAVVKSVQVSAPMVAAGAATVSAVAVPVAAPAVVEVAAQVAPALPVPAVPEVITQSVANVETWKGMGATLWTLKSWALSQPMQAGILLVALVLVIAVPRVLQKS